MDKYEQVRSALTSYISSFNQLMNLSVLANKKDFTCQIGEWFVAEQYGGTRAESGKQKNWDLKVGEKYVQVKAHAKAQTTTARFSAVKHVESAQIDELITVIFTPDYKLKEFYKIPWKDALKLIKKEKYGDVIYWDHQRNYKIKFNDLPNRELTKLFT